MEKVAINWAQEGIDTVSKAKGRQPRYSRTYYDVLKAFGIQGRGPAPAEAEYIRRWIDEYGFSSSLILEACNRTITQIHQPSFNYADKILSGWLEKKVTTQDQLRQLDSAHEKKAKSNKVPAPSPNKSASNRFHNFNQRSYNYSDLEQKLVQKRRISSEH